MFQKQNLLMIGDAAGLIAPLCGNGMSMALNSVYHLTKISDLFLSNKINRSTLEMQYSKWWNNNFSLRLRVGYNLQELMYRHSLTNAAIGVLDKTPFILNRLIKLTHGQPFYR